MYGHLLSHLEPYTLALILCDHHPEIPNNFVLNSCFVSHVQRDTGVQARDQSYTCASPGSHHPTRTDRCCGPWAPNSNPPTVCVTSARLKVGARMESHVHSRVSGGLTVPNGQVSHWNQGLSTERRLQYHSKKHTWSRKPTRSFLICITSCISQPLTLKRGMDERKKSKAIRGSLPFGPSLLTS